jgi:hypothetical protein
MRERRAIQKRTQRFRVLEIGTPIHRRLVVLESMLQRKELVGCRIVGTSRIRQEAEPRDDAQEDGLSGGEHALRIPPHETNGRAGPSANDD